MLSEPMTLYKLMILYLLKQVNVALSENMISEFFLSREYTGYFTLRQALSELGESGLIQLHSTRNASRYSVTEEGVQTLSFFGKRLSPEILADIDRFLRENRFQIRNELSVHADYYPAGQTGYRVHCEVTEGKNSLFSVELTAPEEAQAIEMCRRFSLCSGELYRLLLKELLQAD
jgi:hypothetical protein